MTPILLPIRSSSANSESEEKYCAYSGGIVGVVVEGVSRWVSTAERRRR